MIEKEKNPSSSEGTFLWGIIYYINTVCITSACFGSTKDTPGFDDSLLERTQDSEYDSTHG